MSKRKWRWVTRNDNDFLIDIWGLWRPKPSKRSWGWLQLANRASRATICTREFKKLTGITVPTDKPIKVEFTAKVVE